jgi:hypothetical protein
MILAYYFAQSVDLLDILRMFLEMQHSICFLFYKNYKKQLSKDEKNNFRNAIYFVIAISSKL